jgi:hypothetical protein
MLENMLILSPTDKLILFGEKKEKNYKKREKSSRKTEEKRHREHCSYKCKIYTTRERNKAKNMFRSKNWRIVLGFKYTCIYAHLNVYI